MKKGFVLSLCMLLALSCTTLCFAVEDGDTSSVDALISSSKETTSPEGTFVEIIPVGGGGPVEDGKEEAESSSGIPETTTTDATGSGSSNVDASGGLQNDPQFSNASIDKLNEAVKEKGNDVLGIISTVAGYVALGAVALCIIGLLISIISKNGQTGKWIVGIVVAAVVGTVLKFLPEILDWFSNWLSSSGGGTK